MIDGKLLVEKLLTYAVEFLHLNKRDQIYFRNLLMREFKIEQPLEQVVDLSFIKELAVPDLLVQEIEEYAVQNGLVSEGEKQLYSTYIMGLLCPLPSAVNQEFIRIKKEQGVKKACEYFYDLSVASNYVQKTAISKNLKWTFKDGDNNIDITVNLSKPEKDNKETAKLLTKVEKGNYPKCMLCKENEGYKGRANHPSRVNIRTISLELGGEPWFVQYSPYAYFDEHLIAVSETHSPMSIDGGTIEKLLDFVDCFPNYMIGSNASLPIVGGSILNHEHYQGGKAVMPLFNAKVDKWFTSDKYTNVKVGVLDWYNSVVRLESGDREQIKAFATDIVCAWLGHDDKDCGILSNTDGVPHNSLSPVCRKLEDTYVFDLILRNNRTSEEYPDGIFHAHPEYHNIKKEAIGLIEAMGLFILPGRLKAQFNEIAQILCGEKELVDSGLAVHENMISQLLKDGHSNSFEEAYSRVVEKVNQVCKSILLNTAVFKKDAEGRKGFERFLASLGAK